MAIPDITQNQTNRSSGGFNPTKVDVNNRIQEAINLPTPEDRIQRLNEINEFIGTLPPDIDLSSEKQAIQANLGFAELALEEAEKDEEGEEAEGQQNETGKTQPKESQPVKPETTAQEAKPSGGMPQAQQPEVKAVPKPKPQSKPAVAQPKPIDKAEEQQRLQTLRRILGQDPNVQPGPVLGPKTREEQVQELVNMNRRQNEATSLTGELNKEGQIRRLEGQLAKQEEQIRKIQESVPTNIVTQRRAAYYRNKTQPELAPLIAARDKTQQDISQIRAQLNPIGRAEIGPIYGPEPERESSQDGLKATVRRANDRRNEFDYLRTPYGTLNTQYKTKINFSAKDWLKERKQDYNKAKRDAFYGMMGKITRPVAGPAIGALDAMDASLGRGGKFGLFKDTSKSLYNSKPLGIVRLPVNRFANSRVGQWTSEKSRDGAGWLRDKGSRFDGWLSRVILPDRFLDRDVTTRNYYSGRKRLGAFSNIRFNLRGQYEAERKKKKNRFQSIVAAKVLYEQTIGKLIHNVKQAVKLVKDVAKTYSGLKWLTNQKNIITSNISNKFWSGPLGKAAITVQRISNGIGAVVNSLPSGITTAAATALTSFALTGGIGLIPVAVAGVTGSVIHIAEKTLSDVHLSRFDSIMNFQVRQGGWNWAMQNANMKDVLIMDGVDLVNVRTRLHSLLKSFGWGTAGMAIGTLAGMLIPGLSPLVGAIGGFALGVGTKYTADRVMVNLISRAGESPMLQAISKMPFFETVGLIQSVPWINTQLHGIKSGLMALAGMKNDNYWKYFLRSWNPLKSPLTFFSNFSGGLINIHNGFRLWSWGAGQVTTRLGAASVNGMLIGGGLGLVAGGVIALGLGMPIGAGFLVGGFIGTVVGGVIGSFFGPVGTFIGSFIGSTVGSLFGSWIDKITGNIVDTSKMLESLFGALSLFKSLLDFVKALNEKFDPTNALGLAVTIIFSITLLNEMVKNSSYIDQTENSSAQGIYAERDPNGTGKTVTTRPNTGQVKQITVDCLKEENKIVVNPKTALITDITVKGKYYQISTKYYKFTNIIKPSSGLSVDSTINKGREIGLCY